VQHDDRVEFETTGPGIHSRTTKFEDGTQEAKDSVTQPDGTIVHTTTNRGGTFETTTQDAPVDGQPMLIVTTRTDGTRIEQTLDDERMVTTTFHPKGDTTVRRQDFDGAGSVVDQDANGNQVGPLLVIDGEPLEPRSSLSGDQSDREDIPVGSLVAPSDVAPATSETQPETPPAATVETKDPAEDDLDPVSAPTPAVLDDDFDPVAPVIMQQTSDNPPIEVDPVTAVDPAAPAQPDENAPLIEIDEQGNIEVDDFAENVNFAYTVTETEGGGEIGPDPDVPTDTMESF